VPQQTIPHRSLPLVPPTGVGPPVAQMLPPVQAALLPQRQVGVAELESHHSPGAQQLLPQHAPVVHREQLALGPHMRAPPPPDVPPARASNAAGMLWSTLLLELLFADHRTRV